MNKVKVSHRACRTACNRSRVTSSNQPIFKRHLYAELIFRYNPARSGIYSTFRPHKNRDTCLAVDASGGTIC